MTFYRAKDIFFVLLNDVVPMNLRYLPVYVANDRQRGMQFIKMVVD